MKFRQTYKFTSDIRFCCILLPGSHIGQIMFSTSTDQHFPDSHQTCPYLGTFEDAEAWYGFPDNGNYCYRAKPPSQIDDHHQKTHCLSPNHINCQLLLVKEWNKSLPKEISYREEFDKRTLVLILLTLILLGAIGVLIYFFFEPVRQALAVIVASSTPARLTTLVHPSGSILISLTLVWRGCAKKGRWSC